MRLKQKMAEAVALAKIAGQADVDQALGQAAIHGRFAHKDLASILNAAFLDAAGLRTSTHTASETRSLTQGTSGWATIGQPAANTTLSTTPSATPSATDIATAHEQEECA